MVPCARSKPLRCTWWHNQWTTQSSGAVSTSRWPSWAPCPSWFLWTWSNTDWIESDWTTALTADPGDGQSYTMARCSPITWHGDCELNLNMSMQRQGWEEKCKVAGHGSFGSVGEQLSSVARVWFIFGLSVAALRPLMMMSWCLMSSDVGWHIRDKLWPMPKHVHGNQKAR